MSKRLLNGAVVWAAILAVAWGGYAVSAAPAIDASAVDPAEAVITVDGVSFATWQDYTSSDMFRERGLRCGTVANPGGADPLGGDPGDCTYTVTNPDPIYHPQVAKYVIPVVVHVIRNSAGTQGDISEAMVHSQITILNEDFLALPGTNGGNGTDIQIEFFLATEDPNGNPTNGITYSNNDTWFNDGGNYWDSLAWDTNRYLNIYTNTASGALGYVPDLPQGGIAGSNEDRVVILWSSFGLEGPIGPPFDKGRTTTHEVGHYLGLDHTFADFTCPSETGCYANGDLICDTNPQNAPTQGCTNANGCASPDAIHNYLDYSDDLCMEEFTPAQALRMRCSIEHYRGDLYISTGSTECGNGVVEWGEECDDGGAVPGDGCDETCQYEHTCGDGVLELGEECDDGGESASCDADCTPAACGDGTLNATAGEACDDGGPSQTCDVDCTLAECGDGILNPAAGEACEDGNTVPGDGCDENCQVEGGPAHNCCETGHGPGCSDPVIEACICALDSFCCDVDWDQICVDGVELAGCGTCSFTECGNGIIELGEACDGGDCCAADCTLIAAGTECRAVADQCDVAEACGGFSGYCPTDVFVDASVVCRDAAGECDLSETCPGDGAACGADAKSEAECRPAAGECDLAESCDGTSDSCPPDAKSTDVCRASTGACDPVEACDGAGNACPPDTAITECADGDGCCASGCNANDDSDCDPVCGNGVRETGEECDDGNADEEDGCTSACMSSQPVPAVSQWGLVVLALMLLVAGKVYFGRREALA